MHMHMFLLFQYFMTTEQPILSNPSKLRSKLFMHDLF